MLIEEFKCQVRLVQKILDIRIWNHQVVLWTEVLNGNSVSVNTGCRNIVLLLPTWGFDVMLIIKGNLSV